MRYKTCKMHATTPQIYISTTKPTTPHSTFVKQCIKCICIIGIYIVAHAYNRLRRHRFIFASICPSIPWFRIISHIHRAMQSPFIRVHFIHRQPHIYYIISGVWYNFFFLCFRCNSIFHILFLSLSLAGDVPPNHIHVYQCVSNAKHFA